MKKFWSKINNIIVGGTTVVVVLVLSFIWWLYTPNTMVPMWVLSLVIILGYSVCVIVYAFSSNQEEIIYVLPKVKSIRRTKEKIIILLEKNDLYIQGAYVSIRYQDENDSIETTLGVGYIETINSQGNMQIVFASQSNESDAREIISNLDDKKDVKNAIKIRPIVQKSFLEKGLSYE